MTKKCMLVAGVVCVLETLAEPVKVSERFGFDPNDSTKIIQRALDSKLPEIVLDRQATPWVSGPLLGRSNQTLYFEDGVELRAKKGEFPQTVHPLIRYDSVSNVAIVGLGPRGGVCRMRKDDYHKFPYRPAEWRHGIMFVNAVNFRAENMTIIESGGDGVDILGGKCRNGVIRRVTCDRNNRQGLSVEGCTGLLIEDCVFMNTKGTPPEAGVDFEPYQVNQPMTGIVMRNCRIENNGGNGVDSWTGASDGRTPPYDITVENCIISGNNNAIRIGGSIWWDPAIAKNGLPGGLFTFRNCLLEKSRRHAVLLEAMPKSMRVEFHGCTAQDNDGGHENTDVRLRGYPPDGCIKGSTLPNNILFKDFVVRQPKPRSWAKCEVVTDLTPTLLDNVRGSVRVVDPKGEKTVEFASGAKGR